MTHDDLPLLNATLNALSAVAALLGLILIKRKQIAAHRATMLTGVAISACFLVSYLIYHFGGPARHFAGEGWTKTAYYTMLLTHVLLAVALVPLIIITLTFALRGRIDRHKKIAWWTFSIWMYVSVTGVIVYFAVHG